MSFLFTLHDAYGEPSEEARDLARSLDPQPAARLVARRALELAFPERLDDERFAEAIYRSTLDNVDAMWRIIAGRLDQEAGTPLGALAFGEAAAELDVPVAQFERVYRVGIGLVWMCWYEEAVKYAERTGTDLTKLISAPTLIINAYIDALLSPVLERYDATRAQARRTQDQLRRSIMQAALTGAAVLGEPDACEALGTDAKSDHLAIAVQGNQERVRDIAERARQIAGGQVTSVYRHATETWIVWISSRDGISVGQELALKDALGSSAALCALGDVATGPDALGLTGRDALETARIQQETGEQGVLRHADVRLEILLQADPERTARFVRSELGALSEGGARLDDLRETALVWLASGSNVATAARLGIHEHTVRNRLANAEELIGAPLYERRTELLVALRLQRMTNATATDS